MSVQPINATSSAQSIIASNDGNAVLNIDANGLAAPADFTQAAGSGTPVDCAAGGSVTAGASCNLSIEFTPKTAGTPLSESFVLTDNSENTSGTTHNIALSGASYVPMTYTSPAITTLTDGTVGVPFNQTFAVSGGTGTITYSHSGTLAAGLTLSSGGVLAGTPTDAGPYSFTVTAADSNFNNLSQVYSLTIDQGIPSIADSAWPTAYAITYGQPLSSATLTGGTTALPTVSTLTITGLPVGATATVTPSTWVQTSGTTWTYPANVALSDALVTIQLPAATARNAEPNSLRPHLPAVLWGMLLLPFAGRMRRAGKRLGRTLSLLLLMTIAAAAIGLSGCGSGNGFYSQQQKTYNVIMTVSSGTLSHISTMTLTVQ